MNKEETTAKKYLESLQMGNVAFEPDGQIPPDFTVASRIAIEVRRLNENYFGGSRTSGLEEVDRPLHSKLKKVLTSYDRKFDGHSYLVALSFKRPLLDGIAKVGKEMHLALDNFLRGTRPTPSQVKVNNNISFEIFPYHAVPNRVFLHGTTSDDDSGGIVVQLYATNISHCIREKSQKISRYRSRYTEWWLLLVDTVRAWDLMPDEVQQVRGGIPNIGSFDQLIIIDYLGSKCFLRIP
ncbi:MAG: hypothetical protein HY707_13580 [Ignavibacteriae bacterium]|nr:hypothetical protein [Ignavibacteriota bacterium]